MALKVTIRGEVFSFEPEYPLHEAIEIEEGLGMAFGRWQQGMAEGSARARAGLVWIVLRRAGREVPMADIVSGEFPLTTGDVIVEEEGEEAPGPPSSATTSGDGSPSSPPPSDTPPPRSEGSPSMSSTT